MNILTFIKSAYAIYSAITSIALPLIFLYTYFQRKAKKTAVETAEETAAKKAAAEKAAADAAAFAKEQYVKATELETNEKVWNKVYAEMKKAEIKYGKAPPTMEWIKIQKHTEVSNAVKLCCLSEGISVSDELIDLYIEEYMEQAKTLNPRKTGA